MLVVDMQEKLLPHMHNAQPLEQQVSRLLDGTAVLGLPVLAAQHYPKGLGQTVPGIASRLADAVCRCDKLKFSACIKPVREALVRCQARCVLVCGVEAHVCVLQTCLDLIDAGYVTAMALDAIGSRRLTDQQAAVSRLTQAGVIPTTVESALLEWVHEAGTNRFKQMLPLIK